MNLIEISIAKLIATTPDNVFEAWLNPQTPGGPWYGVERVIINPVVNGMYYHAVKHQGRTWSHYGRFLKVKRYKSLEFTWVSEATQGIESIVSLTFQPQDDQTLVTLVHSQVPDDERGRRHREGWNWVLSNLAKQFAPN
ncbi:MAG: SRPBCC domain-containing protein [Planctomycetes bacterium]|nr:SRPBCC domain-containing protein [Planctomycetota bacterium]